MIGFDVEYIWYPLAFIGVRRVEVRRFSMFNVLLQFCMCIYVGVVNRAHSPITAILKIGFWV